MQMLLRRGWEKYRADGIAALIDAGTQYLWSAIADARLYAKYRHQYGTLAPRPNERLWLDPTTIDYSIWSGYLPKPANRPIYGVLDGNWDLHKSHWRDTFCEGLRERYVDGAPWEETIYYRNAIERLRSGDTVGYLDGPQTEQNFLQQLEAVDALYYDIKENGYDDDSTIVVYIGRDGTWMVSHGNHRRTIARILGIKTIPVRVKYRHAQWQAIRQRFYSATDRCDIAGVERYCGHPDVPSNNAP